MRRRMLTLVAVVAAVACAALIESDHNPADGPCGPPILKSDGSEWSCEFADDFDAAELDRTKWSVMLTETSGFSHAGECYIDDPSTVSVRDGALRLTARHLEEGFMCGSKLTSLVSGMLHTKDTFAQAYGRFEARIKMPEGSGLHGAWWLWPREMAYGRQSGEIDIAEHWGTQPDAVFPFAHVIATGGEERGRGGYCTVAEPSDAFHTYALEWTPPGRMVFIYDGVPCMTFEGWDPGAPLAYPQPFDQPFFLNLTLALESGEVSKRTPFPGTMSVDHVRAWR